MTPSNTSPAVVSTPSTAAKALSLLASPRIDPYKDLFKPVTDEGHLGCYMWGQAVSASLHPFLGLAEVVLRNAIHQSLSEQCSRGNATSHPWYDRVDNNSIPLRGKSLERIENLLCSGMPPVRKAVQPTPDAVVSNLTFGFWPNVMEGLNERHAPRAFTSVFAHHPHSRPNHWSWLSNKAPVVLRLKRLQDVRNRVCHFEPVWKPHWLGATAPNWSHAVLGLRNLHGELLELLGWCSPVAVDLYKASFGWNWFNKLCTTDSVRGFMAGHVGCAELKTVLAAVTAEPAVSTPTAVGGQIPPTASPNPQALNLL